MRFIAIILALLLSAPGTVSPAELPAAQAMHALPVAHVASVRPAASLIAFPVEQFRERDTLKEFGTWVDDGRFLGYHLGDDIEYGDVADEVPVRAVADGTVLHAGWVSGYGGMMLVRHEVNGRTVNAIYGHLDPASLVKEGETVKKGEQIAVLGDAFTHETDGRRKHLHFGLYEGTDLRFNGYTLDVNELATWIDPAVFFAENMN